MTRKSDMFSLNERRPSTEGRGALHDQRTSVSTVPDLSTGSDVIYYLTYYATTWAGRQAANVARENSIMNNDQPASHSGHQLLQGQTRPRDNVR